MTDYLKKLIRQCEFMKKWEYPAKRYKGKYPYNPTQYKLNIKEANLNKENVSFKDNEYTIRTEIDNDLVVCTIKCYYI